MGDAFRRQAARIRRIEEGSPPMTTPTPSEPLGLRAHASAIREHLKAFSSDVEDPRVLRMHFDRKTSTYDRLSIVALLNGIPAALDRLAQQASTIEALEKGLEAIVASLTSDGRNRGTCLSINHDELSALVRSSTALLSTLREEKEGG